MPVPATDPITIKCVVTDFQKKNPPKATRIADESLLTSTAVN